VDGRPACDAAARPRVRPRARRASMAATTSARATTCSATRATAATRSTCACPSRTSSSCPTPSASSRPRHSRSPSSRRGTCSSRARGCRPASACWCSALAAESAGRHPDCAAARCPRHGHRRQRREAGARPRAGRDEVMNHTTDDVPPPCAASPTAAVWTSWSSTSAPPRGTSSLRCLARSGRLVTCGATTGHDAAIDLRFLFSRQLSLLGSYMGRKSELLRAAGPVLRGRADAGHRQREARWRRRPTAHRRLEAREGFGKIVLTPCPG
jgi:hypothetical protein